MKTKKLTTIEYFIFISPVIIIILSFYEMFLGQFSLAVFAIVSAFIMISLNHHLVLKDR